MGDLNKSTSADSQIIQWLLHESGVSRYQISKDTGISESTLSRLASGETLMTSINFGYAIQLTKYARGVKIRNKYKTKGD